MVQEQAAARFGLPLSLFTYDNELTDQLNTALYQPSTTGQVLAPNSVTFHYAAGGLDVVKTFSFDTSYVVGARRQGKAQRDAGACAGCVARRAWRHGRVPCRRRHAHHLLGAYRFAVRLVDRRQAGYRGVEQGERQRDHSISPTSMRRIMRSLFRCRSSCPMCRSARRWLPSTTPSICPAISRDPNSAQEAGRCDWAGDWRPERRYAACVSTQDRRRLDILNSVRAMGPDGKPTGESLSSLIQYGWWSDHRQAAVSWLCGACTRPAGSRQIQLGLGHHHRHRDLQPDVAAHAHLVMKSSLKMMRIQPQGGGAQEEIRTTSR